jgi:hypothetical protein
MTNKLFKNKLLKLFIINNLLLILIILINTYSGAREFQVYFSLLSRTDFMYSFYSFYIEDAFCEKWVGEKINTEIIFNIFNNLNCLLHNILGLTPKENTNIWSSFCKVWLSLDEIYWLNFKNSLYSMHIYLNQFWFKFYVKGSNNVLYYFGNLYPLDDINIFKYKYIWPPIGDIDINSLSTNTFSERIIENKRLIRSEFKANIQLMGGLPNNNLNLSLTSQLDSIVNLYNEYNFYPLESKVLFSQYIETIDTLLGFLNENKLKLIEGIQKENIAKELTINKELTNKLNSLLVDVVSNMPLPEETDEELDALYEYEDYMYDAIYSMNMFSEESEE